MTWGNAMEYLAWFGGSAIFVGVLWFALRKKNKKTKSFEKFVAAVVAAADEGERAYLAQVSSMSLVPSIRAIALARFASALFPVSAYSVANSNGLLLPWYQHESLQGTEVWQLPSGIALKPIFEREIRFDSERVKNDQQFGVNQFVDVFNSRDPSAAIEKLAPVWKQVLSADNPISPSIQNTANTHCIQYVTSGMVLFSQWYEEITGTDIAS